MKKVLAIRTTDRDYAEKLADNLGKSDGNIFETLVFTDEKAYSDYVEQNRIDVLLCDETLMGPTDKGIKPGLICRFSENCLVNDTITEDTPIFKYQSSENIMKEIMIRYRMKMKTDDRVYTEKLSNRNIFCVTSPQGGSGCSTYALALAKFFSQKGKTLFMSFDPFFLLPEVGKNPNEMNMTDVIYHMKEAKSLLVDFITSISFKSGNLECINGVSHWFDLYDLSPECMNALLDEVCNRSEYENIIFDVGIIGAASMEIYLSSKKIYVTLNEEKSGKKKYNEWRRQLTYGGYAELFDRISEVKVPEDEILKGEYDYDTLLSGALGKYIEERECIKYHR